MSTGFFEKAAAVQASNENVSITENGAIGYKTTGRSLLDLNFSVPQMRSMSEMEIQKKWEQAYAETPELAMRWLFFLRDVRGGMGERRAFRAIIKWMTETHPSEIRKLINTDNMFTQYIGEIIPFYGRWDDLMILSDNPQVSRKIYSAISKQLAKDKANMEAGQPISLLAKWLPSLTNKNSNKAARKLCKKIGMLETPYRKLISALRQYLKVTEVQMSGRQWDQIDYEKVPSRASMIYGKAFSKHDPERYKAFITAVNNGEKKINSATLFPHEIVHRIKATYPGSTDEGMLEGLWKNLPNTIPQGQNTIVVRDGSGSMRCQVDRSSDVRAMDVGDALSIYFAERMSGEFHNKIITFSENPRFIQFDENIHTTLKYKLNYLARYTEVANTNIEAVFNLILQTAVTHHMSQEDMPTNILIISDMEFDGCVVDNNGMYAGYFRNNRLFDVIKKRYEQYGYKLPRVVFWNVNSRSGAIPMKENEMGVALVSGFSTNVAKMVMSAKTDPWDCLVEQLSNARYDPISLALGYTQQQDHI